MFKNNLILVCLILIALASCKEDKLGALENDGKGPAPVSNVVVENLPGSAKITYSLPADEDLMYIQAEYVNKRGEKLEFKSSLYTNYITVNGFGDVSEYDVTLYAVDRGQNKSEPLMVKVNPLTPPVNLVYESLNVSEGFGGIVVSFENTEKANVVINVLTDSLGQWIPVNQPAVLYTSSEGGDFPIRGYAAQERKFAVFIKDKFGNISDTLKVTRLPLAEKEMDMTKFSELRLDNDVPPHPKSPMRYMWDGEYTGNKFFYRTNNSGEVPHSFTMDMGVVAKISRFKLFQRGFGYSNDYLFNRGNPENIEIWGSLEKPAQDGSWDGWTKLTDFKSIKPSGNSVGTNTSEDLEYARAGDDCIFPVDSPPVRYVRFKVLNTWGNTNFSNIMELKVWGSY